MLTIPSTFLQDEVRCGFYISPYIKQAWAAQLKTLSVVDEICQKHGIDYFASWGTLLAAVRHGGYIPWDDDIDICMKRADYNKFKEAAKTEFPEGFFIQDFTNTNDHWYFIKKVVNTNRKCFETKHMEKYENFPYIACVDIFILDYVHTEKQEERKRCDAIMNLLAVAEGIITGTFQKETIHTQISKINCEYSLQIPITASATEMGIAIYSLIENLMGEVPEKEAEEITQIYPFFLKGGPAFPKKWYEKPIRMPFEFTTMPVTPMYNKTCAKLYGADYMSVRKGRSAHDYPFYEGQKAELVAMADFKFPEFEFDKAIMLQGKPDESFKDIAWNCLSEMTNLTESIKLSAIEGDAPQTADALADLQNLALDLGNFTEGYLGEGNEIVKNLETLCERIFLLYNACEQSLDLNPEDVIEAMQDVTTVAGKILFGKKKALFVATDEASRILFDKLAQNKKKNGYNTEVIKIPSVKKNPLGQFMEEAPDFTLTYADEIYFSNPYDAEHPTLSVNPKAYAENLRNFCEKLVLVAPENLLPFGTDDFCDVYNAKKFLKTPGVMWADEILVPGAVKEVYLKLLNEITAGEDLEEYWENKLKEIELPENKKPAFEKKKILYCIGANELVEFSSREAFIATVKERLDTFAEAKDKLDVIIRLYPEDENIWKTLDNTAFQELSDNLANCMVPGTYTIQQIVRQFPPLPDTCTAYYGQATPYVQEFVTRKKPVMISEIR